MTESNLERYRTAWQGGKSFGNRPLSQDEIDTVLNKASRDIRHQFRVGLIVDMALKGFAAIALAVLLFLFRDSPALGWLNGAVLLFTLFLLFVQWQTLQEIPGANAAGDSLRDCLQAMIRFFRKRYIRALYVAAVSGSLVFYTGMLFYSWFKYGGIRPLEADDYAVIVTGLLLAFAINAVAQRWQAGFQVRELEVCLREIDTETLSAQDLRKQRHRRIRAVLMWAVWFVLGILVLTWFIAR